MSAAKFRAVITSMTESRAAAVASIKLAKIQSDEFSARRRMLIAMEKGDSFVAVEVDKASADALTILNNIHKDPAEMSKAEGIGRELDQRVLMNVLDAMTPPDLSSESAYIPMSLQEEAVGLEHRACRLLFEQQIPPGVDPLTYGIDCKTTFTEMPSVQDHGHFIDLTDLTETEVLQHQSDLRAYRARVEADMFHTLTEAPAMQEDNINVLKEVSKTLADHRNEMLHGPKPNETAFSHRSIAWAEKKFITNLYSDENNYKPFPGIGKKIVKIQTPKMKINPGRVCGYLNFSLIQGHRRMIRVMYRSNVALVVTPRDFIEAARIADQKGWRNVILQADDFIGETLEVVNVHQYYTNWDNCRTGISIRAIDSFQEPMRLGETYYHSAEQ